MFFVIYEDLMYNMTVYKFWFVLWWTFLHYDVAIDLLGIISNLVKENLIIIH